MNTKNRMMINPGDFEPVKVNESQLFFDHWFLPGQREMTIMARAFVKFRPISLWIETYESILISYLRVGNKNIFIQDNGPVDAYAFRSRYRLDMPTMELGTDISMQILRTSEFPMRFHAEIQGAYIDS